MVLLALMYAKRPAECQDMRVSGSLKPFDTFAGSHGSIRHL